MTYTFQSKADVQPADHQVECVEHHRIPVGEFDPEVVGSMTEAELADLCVHAVADARAWAESQGVEISPSITDTRTYGPERCHLAVTWDVVRAGGVVGAGFVYSGGPA